jgi:hypothetical protein
LKLALFMDAKLDVSKSPDEIKKMNGGQVVPIEFLHGRPLSQKNWR